MPNGEDTEKIEEMCDGKKDKEHRKNGKEGNTRTANQNNKRDGAKHELEKIMRRKQSQQIKDKEKNDWTY